jgi:hypothetical protein
MHSALLFFLIFLYFLFFPLVFFLFSIYLILSSHRTELLHPESPTASSPRTANSFVPHRTGLHSLATPASTPSPRRPLSPCPPASSPGGLASSAQRCDHALAAARPNDNGTPAATAARALAIWRSGDPRSSGPLPRHCRQLSFPSLFCFHDEM